MAPEHGTLSPKCAHLCTSRYRCKVSAPLIITRCTPNAALQALFNDPRLSVNFEKHQYEAYRHVSTVYQPACRRAFQASVSVPMVPTGVQVAAHSPGKDDGILGYEGQFGHGGRPVRFHHLRCYRCCCLHATVQLTLVIYIFLSYNITDGKRRTKKRNKDTDNFHITVAGLVKHPNS
jgi:hypothetical protein